MRFAIIEDLEKESLKIQELLFHYGKEHNIDLTCDCFSSGESFLSSFTAFYYDIIFMDIFMDKTNGIETALSMRALDNRSILIFLTSSTEHMAEAFRCHAYEYISKPVARERLFAVLDDALSVLPAVENNLVFSSNGLNLRLRFSELLCFSTIGRTTEIIDCHGTAYQVNLPFRQLYDQVIKDSRFLQINRSILVNMDYIIRFDHKNCQLANHITLPITLRKALQYEQTWRDYTFSQLHASMDKRRSLS